MYAESLDRGRVEAASISSFRHIQERVSPRELHMVSMVQKRKQGDPAEFPFTLQNCVLTRLDFSKNSFRIKGGNVGRGRALRGSVHEEGQEAKSW